MANTLASIGAKLDVAIERIANLKEDFNSKHRANQQHASDLDDRLTKVELKLNTLWAYMVSAGVVTGAAIKLLDKYWK